MAARSTTTMLMVLAAAVALSGVAIAAEEKPVSRDADLSVREIVSTLFQAKPGARIDFAGKNLAYLDLAGINFKRADLSGADLYGVDFTGSNLRGVDLDQSRLDRAVLIRADLSGANLREASILRPTIYADLSNNTADAPRFAGADLTNVRVMANMAGADFHGADLSGANFGAGSVLDACDFARAILKDIKLERTTLAFARFTGADLRGANLAHTDLSRADFTGADLTNADLTGAELDGANLLGVKGLDTVKGLSTAHNFETTIR